MSALRKLGMTVLEARTVGRAIRAERMARGWTQTRLTLEAGFRRTKQPMVSMLERGSPRPTVLARVTATLGLDVTEMLKLPRFMRAAVTSAAGASSVCDELFMQRDIDAALEQLVAEGRIRTCRACKVFWRWGAVHVCPWLLPGPRDI